MERKILANIKENLSNDEVILIIGPRQVGKTTSMRQIYDYLKYEGNLCHFLNLEDPDYLRILNDSPKKLFNIIPFDKDKRNYLFIDEIQYLKDPSNFLKYFYDEYKGKIKIIASGSSAFYLDKKFKDSLAGRKKILYLLTLSFNEFLNFKGEDDLSKMDLSKELPLQLQEKIMPLYLEYLTYGGYPRVVLAKSIQEKEDVLKDLAYSYIKKDIYEAGINQEQVFFRLMKILSGQVGELVNVSELSATLGVTKITIDKYLAVMQKSFYIFLMRPFYKNIRKELTKMPKVYFGDSGMRNFFKNNFNIFYDRDDKGQLLENGTFRQFLNKFDMEDLRFWRTRDKKEVDFVINEKQAFEVKIKSSNYNEDKYKLFLENYPKIPLNYIVLEKEKQTDKNNLLYPWQI
ncbi:MAG: ATP-binding protein [Candidatus Magasanikbacteria bacterium]|nr:ATP-binding protein [Candidatus Magasanikbacteria bacterium]